MKTHDVFYANMDSSDYVLKAYLKDMTDAELMTRPCKGCNHIAFQLGHLIVSEQQLLEQLSPGSGLPLPEGFADKHHKKNVEDNDPTHFYTKQEYLDLYKKSRQNVKDVLSKMSESDLDKPSPKGWEMFPTVGAIANLVASHGMMHVGQFAVVRRMLGKPIVI